MRNILRASLAAVLVGCIPTLLHAEGTKPPDLVKMNREMLAPTTTVVSKGSTGSGVTIYSKERDGEVHTYVLTNHHVIANSLSISKNWSDSEKKMLESQQKSSVSLRWNSYSRKDGRLIDTSTKSAEIVAHDEKRDLALLRLWDNDQTVGTVAYFMPKGTLLMPFTPVWSVGSALGLPPFPTQGSLSNTDIRSGNERFYLTSAPITFGNSGGAQFVLSPERDRYEMIGISARVAVGLVSFPGTANPEQATVQPVLTEQSSDPKTEEKQVFSMAVAPHMGYIVPADTVRQFLEDAKFGFILGK